jgi:hypothetical protein
LRDSIKAFLSRTDTNGGEEAKWDKYNLSPKIKEALRELDTKEIITKEVDFSKALRKFSNINILNIAKILYLEGELSFKDLKIKTALSVNTLNHALQEMKAAELVVSKEKNYAITNYGAIILIGILYIKENLKCVEDFPRLETDDSF